MKIDISSSVPETETAHVLRVEPEEIPEQRFPRLCAVLWWALPGCVSPPSPTCSTTGAARGDAAHIPALVLRAYLAAVDRP